jgi:hypothetical protein
VTLRLTRWRGWRGRAFAVALALALTPLPAAANEALPSTSAAPSRPAAPATKATSPVSLKESAARAAVRTPLVSASRARRAEQDTVGKDSPGFFKTKGGAVALAVMAIGVGYALYSVKHDRITSPAKQ